MDARAPTPGAAATCAQPVPQPEVGPCTDAGTCPHASALVALRRHICIPWSDLTLLEPLRISAKSEVYRAHWHAAERDVAVKRMCAQPCACGRITGGVCPCLVDRLWDEAILHMTASHDNIVRVLGVAWHKDYPELTSIVMQLMSTDLEEYLRRGATAALLAVASGDAAESASDDGAERAPPTVSAFTTAGTAICATTAHDVSTAPSGVSVGQRLRMLHQVALALRSLHVRGISYGDPKAANVLLDESLNAYLADFGWAVGGAEVTGSGGTLLRKAPELLRDEGMLYRPTSESDMWAFGLLVWEVLTSCATQPFAHYPDFARVMTEAISDPRVLHERLCCQTNPWRPRLAALPAETPREVVELLSACLQLLPSARPTARTACATLLAAYHAVGAVAAQPGAAVLFRSVSVPLDGVDATHARVIRAMCTHYHDVFGVLPSIFFGAGEVPTSEAAPISLAQRSGVADSTVLRRVFAREFLQRRGCQLLVAKAGAGKSTFLRLIAFRWAHVAHARRQALTAARFPEAYHRMIATSGRSAGMDEALASIPICFYINLRAIAANPATCLGASRAGRTQAQILAAWITTSASGGPVNEAELTSLVEYALNDGSASVLWLVDSFDEVVEDKTGAPSALDGGSQPRLRASLRGGETGILHATAKYVLQQPCVILATRPECADCVSGDRTFVNDLSDSDVEQWIQTRIRDPDRARHILDRIRASPAAWALAHVPVNLQLMCMVHADALSRKMPLEHVAHAHGVAELYARMEDMVVRRLVHRASVQAGMESGSAPLGAAVDIRALWQPVSTLLASRSWTCMQFNHDAFSLDEYRTGEGGRILHLAIESGLLTELPDGNFTFGHRTILEYYAAKEATELVGKNDEDAMSTIRALLLTAAHDMFARFVIGLAPSVSVVERMLTLCPSSASVRPSPDTADVLVLKSEAVVETPLIKELHGRDVVEAIANDAWTRPKQLERIYMQGGFWRVAEALTRCQATEARRQVKEFLTTALPASKKVASTTAASFQATMAEPTDGRTDCAPAGAFQYIGDPWIDAERACHAAYVLHHICGTHECLEQVFTIVATSQRVDPRVRWLAADALSRLAPRNPAAAATFLELARTSFQRSWERELPIHAAVSLLHATDHAPQGTALLLEMLKDVRIAASVRLSAADELLRHLNQSGRASDRRSLEALRDALALLDRNADSNSHRRIAELVTGITRMLGARRDTSAASPTMAVLHHTAITPVRFV